MTTTLTHWRKGFNPLYLGAYSLAPTYKDWILTIKNIKQDTEVVDQDGKKGYATVCHFVENCKPMILNATNSRVIVKISGSEFIEKWEGLKIQIFVARIREPGAKKGSNATIDCLRIRAFAPKTELPELMQNTETWDKAIEHMVDNGFTIDQVEKKYKLSPESKVALLKEVSDKIAEKGEAENV